MRYGTVCLMNNKLAKVLFAQILLVAVGAVPLQASADSPLWKPCTKLGSKSNYSISGIKGVLTCKKRGPFDGEAKGKWTMYWTEAGSTSAGPKALTTPATTPATTPVAPAVSGQIGVAVNAADGLTVTLVSFSKIEMSASFQYKISYTLVNNTQNKIAEGAFKLFPGSGQGLPQYGSFSDMFPGKTISRSYTFEEMKAVSFTQLSYAPDQFFAKAVPAGAIVWQVPS
jgi:hypothetical protein